MAADTFEARRMPTLTHCSDDTTYDKLSWVCKVWYRVYLYTRNRKPTASAATRGEENVEVLLAVLPSLLLDIHISTTQSCLHYYH